tara:strand:- start:481 stop:1080 length:600 start_codon:yes stop_codon:yes gene_type:complete
MFNASFMPGATVVGLTFKGGVILAAEKRISYGHFVVSHKGKKVFKITDYVGAACAGMVADMQVLMKEIGVYSKLRELESRKTLQPNSIAKLMGVLLFERRFVPLLTQVVIGGFDSKPSVYVLDPLGSVIPDEYATVGTGAEVAIGVIETEFTSGLSEAKAKDLAVKAIRAAIQRDTSSGDGVDLLIITSDGSKEELVQF